jgi:dTDP-4-amino-4,6-dideoxygalactose transaminase
MRSVDFYLAAISPMEAMRLAAAAPAVLLAGVPRQRWRSRFEQAWAARHSGGNALAFPSARSALTASLIAGGVRPGDDVLATGFTCAAVAEAIVAGGARPVWVDIEPDRFGMSPEALGKAVTPNTRAVVVQHTFGLMADLSDLRRALKTSDTLVVEDSCLALGSSRAGVTAGAVGDAAIFSFELSKTISAGWGGMAQVNSSGLSDAVREIRDRSGVLSRREAGSRLLQAGLYKFAYSPGLVRFLGYPAAALMKLGIFRDSSGRTSPHPVEHPKDAARAVDHRGYMAAQADAHWAVLLAQFGRLDTIIAAQRAAAEKYFVVLKKHTLGGWLAWKDPGETLIRFPLVARDPERMAAHFARSRIALGRWFDAPVSPMPHDASTVNYRPGQCPVAEELCRHIVNLPVHPRLSPGDLDVICGALDGYLAKYAEERDFIAAWMDRAAGGTKRAQRN